MKKNILVNGLSAQAWNASESGKVIDQWLAGMINTANSTVYDKAIDAEYLSTHIGGSSLHHLIDGNHDIFSALEVASKALPNDSIVNEVIGASSHLLKDLFSVSGIPIVSISPTEYKNGSYWISKNLGIPKSWQSDLLQINATELLGGTVSALATYFAMKEKDVKLLSEIASSSVFFGIASANPIALISALIAISYSIKKKKSFNEILEGGTMGIGSSVSVWLVSLALSPFTIGITTSIFTLIVSVIVGGIVRKYLSKYFNSNSEVNTLEVQNDIESWNKFLEVKKTEISQNFSPEVINALKYNLKQLGI